MTKPGGSESQLETECKLFLLWGLSTLRRSYRNSELYTRLFASSSTKYIRLCFSSGLCVLLTQLYGLPGAV